MIAVSSWRLAMSLAVLVLLAMIGTPAHAATKNLCTADGQILLPSGTCMAGYYGYTVSNCQAVGSNALVVQVPSGHLTCVAGPTCPSGYVQGMPPPQNAFPGLMVQPSMCQAVCSPVFAFNHWPCTCPYGQKLDSSGSCVNRCAPDKVWQHSPGYQSLAPGGYLTTDDGVCGCPTGKVMDSSGACIASYNPGPSPYCKIGAEVPGCTCPPSSVKVGGHCVICKFQGGSFNNPACASQPPPGQGRPNILTPAGPRGQ